MIVASVSGGACRKDFRSLGWNVGLDEPRTFGFSLKYRFDTEPECSSILVKSNLTAQAFSIVGQAAANAEPAQVTRLNVTGHTDTVGSNAYNMRLNCHRAESVAARLEKDGIPSNEIKIFAKGKRGLLISNTASVKELRNRSVQIVYSGGPTS
jgi:hypothetical protein